jgi:hypothetical protein
MPVRLRPLLSTLADWADSYLRGGATPSSPRVPYTVLEHVIIHDAQLMFTENDDEWVTVDLIAGSGWSSLEGGECALPPGQPVTVKLEIEPGVSARLVAQRVDLLRSWLTTGTRLKVEITKFLEGPGATRIVIAGGGRRLDVSLTS